VARMARPRYAGDFVGEPPRTTTFACLTAKHFFSF